MNRLIQSCVMPQTMPLLYRITLVIEDSEGGEETMILNGLTRNPNETHDVTGNLCLPHGRVYRFADALKGATKTQRQQLTRRRAQRRTGAVRRSLAGAGQ